MTMPDGSVQIMGPDAFSRVESQVEMLVEQVSLIQEQLVNLMGDMRQLRYARSSQYIGVPIDSSSTVPLEQPSPITTTTTTTTTTSTTTEKEKPHDISSNITVEKEKPDDISISNTTTSGEDSLTSSQKEGENSAEEIRRRRILRFSAKDISKLDS